MDIVPVKQLDHIDQFLMTFDSPHTRDAYERDLKGYVQFSQGSDPISFANLVSYREYLISKSAPATVVRKFSAVKSFMSFLASQGLIAMNPAQNLKVPKSRIQTHTEAFDDDEVATTINKADVNGFHGSIHRIALVLLFHMGVRRSEVVNLRVRSISDYRGQKFMTIHGKGNKQRLIPITEYVLEEINSYFLRYQDFTGEELLDSDFLIQSSPYEKNDKALNPNSIWRIVKQYARKAGVTKRVSPHSCRATMISHLLEKGISPRSVADVAGHSSINTTVGLYDKKRDILTNSAAKKVDYGQQG